jgi:excisionase family DNA binding protein
MTTDISVPQSVAQAQQPEQYIDKAEVARRLDVQVRTIDNWMRQGKIPYFKISRAVKFKWSDVDSFMRDRYRVVQPASK